LLEARDELLNRSQVSGPREAWRTAILAPDYGVLAAGIVGPLKTVRSSLEVGKRVDRHRLLAASRRAASTRMSAVRRAKAAMIVRDGGKRPPGSMAVAA
jgi:hypothetical protein